MHSIHTFIIVNTICITFITILTTIFYSIFNVKLYKYEKETDSIKTQIDWRNFSLSIIILIAVALVTYTLMYCLFIKNHSYNKINK